MIFTQSHLHKNWPRLFGIFFDSNCSKLNFWYRYSGIFCDHPPFAEISWSKKYFLIFFNKIFSLLNTWSDIIFESIKSSKLSLIIKSGCFWCEWTCVGGKIKILILKSAFLRFRSNFLSMTLILRCKIRRNTCKLF